MRKNLFLKVKIIGIITFILILTGCSAQKESGGEFSYEETKKMVVDILKSDDGKKALQEVMKNEEMKKDLVLDQNIVTETIQTTLTSEEGKKLYNKLFDDPKFVETYVKSLQKEHQELIKDLMKDPDYQKMLMEVFQDPEMQKTMQTAIKSQEFRKYLQEVIMETLSSPLYKAKIQEALLKAAQESGQQSQEKSNDKSNNEKSGGQSSQQ